MSIGLENEVGEQTGGIGHISESKHHRIASNDSEMEPISIEQSRLELIVIDDEMVNVRQVF